MSNSLQDKFANLRRRARIMAMVYGLCTVLGIALTATILLGLTDYLFHFQDRGLRIISSVAFFGIVGWTSYRYIFLPRLVQLSDVDLAVKLQGVFPTFEDRLVSTVEFIAQDEDDPTAGSPGLRRSVIAGTTAEAEELDFSEAIDSRPVVKAALRALAACIAVSMLIFFEPGASQTAIARLLYPLNNAAWPRNNHLEIRDSIERLARGRAFEIEVVDSQGKPLPNEVYLQYMLTGDDGSTVKENVLMPKIGNVAQSRRENILRSFSYRVEGGDDNFMPWRQVEVVDPPAVDSLSIKLIPPAYTGWARKNAEKNIRALIGTRFEIVAEFTKPLKTASFFLENGGKLNGKLSEDGLHATFDDPELVVKKTGSYGFELTDQYGMGGGNDDRWDIQAVPDSKPSVNIDQPSANLYVTPTAVVPLKITAKDDIALRDIVLVFKQSQTDKSAASDGSSNANTASTGGPVQDTAIPLYNNTNKNTQESSGTFSQAVQSGDRQVIDYSWRLDSLHLMPGMQIVFQAEASDYMPQTVRSEPRKLFIVSQSDLLERMANRQGLLLSELDRVLTMQRAVQAQVEGIQISLDETKNIDQAELDRLRAGELSQRQVNMALTARGEGIPSHVIAMLADLENNRIEHPELKERLDNVMDEIERLKQDELPEIGREFTSAVKTAEIAATGDHTPTNSMQITSDALKSVGKGQGRIVESLEKMAAQLNQSDANRRFQRELAQLISQQEETAQRTTDVSKRTLTKDFKDIAPQDAADLKVLASRELEHARSIDRLLQEMQDFEPKLQKDDPLAARILVVALEEASRMDIGAQMRSCADGLRQNRMGQSAERQNSILDNLRRILEILVHKSTRTLAEQLAKLENLVKDIRKRQEKMLYETRTFEQQRQSQGQLARAQLAALVDLDKLQRALQIDTVQLSDQLAPSAVFSLAIDKASRDMGTAADLLDRRTTASETQQSQQNAIHILDMLLESLKQDPQTAQQNSPKAQANKKPGDAPQQAKQQQSLANLAELKLLKLMQEEINVRTAALAEAVGPEGKPTEQQRREFERMADEQAKLAEMVLKMISGK